MPKSVAPNLELEPSLPTQTRNRFESEEDEVAPTNWMSSTQSSSKYTRDRTGKDVLKFQSKEHRYTSNYFGIDEFSGDFKDDELCPGSEFRYQRYFNAKIGPQIRSASTRENANQPRRISHLDSYPMLPKKYHDSEVIILPPNSRRQILIKVFGDSSLASSVIVSSNCA